MLKIHVGGNVFECDNYAIAKRLAGWFREELEAHLTCVRCQKMVAIPLREIERMGPTSRIFDASDPSASSAEWWHFIEAEPRWPRDGWICDTCWAQYLAVVIRFPEDNDED